MVVLAMMISRKRTWTCCITMRLVSFFSFLFYALGLSCWCLFFSIFFGLFFQSRGSRGASRAFKPGLQRATGHNDSQRKPASFLDHVQIGQLSRSTGRFNFFSPEQAAYQIVRAVLGAAAEGLWLFIGLSPAILRALKVPLF